MFLFSLCLIGEWGGERLWGGVRSVYGRRMEENLIFFVFYFSRGSLLSRGGGKFLMERERMRTENEREIERERGKGKQQIISTIPTYISGLHCYHFRNNLLWSNNRLLPQNTTEQLFRGWQWGQLGGARGHPPPVALVPGRHHPSSVDVIPFPSTTTMVDHCHRHRRCRQSATRRVDELRCHLLLLLHRGCRGGGTTAP